MYEICLPGEKITRAIAKLFLDLGEAVLKEFILKNSCRAELILVSQNKSSLLLR